MPKTRKDKRHTRSSGDAPDPLPLIKRKKNKKKTQVHDATEQQGESRRASAGGDSNNPLAVDQQRLQEEEERQEILRQSQILKQCPDWHPVKKDLQIELYERMQVSTTRQLWTEKKVQLSTLTNKTRFNVYSYLQNVYKDIEWTEQMIDFVLAWHYLHNVKNQLFKSNIVQTWPGFAILPLFFYDCCSPQKC